MAVVKGFEPEGGERLLVAAAGLPNSLKSSSSHSSSSVGLDMGRPEQGRLLRGCDLLGVLKSVGTYTHGFLVTLLFSPDMSTTF